MKTSLTIGICTKSRPTKCTSLILQLKELLPYAASIVVVEDISDEQYFSQNSLVKLIGHRHDLKVDYFKVNFCNISQSRKLLVTKTKTSHLIFIDDDVVISNNSIKNCFGILSRKTDVALVVGILYPLATDTVSMTEFIYYNHTRYRSAEHYLTMCPFSFVGMNLTSLEKSEVKFRPEFTTSEDIDFSLQVYEKGLKIVYTESVKNYHDFSKSVLKYFFRSIRDGVDIYKLCHYHGKSFPLKSYLVFFRRMDYLLFIPNILNKTNIFTKKYPNAYHLPNKISILLYLRHLIILSVVNFQYLGELARGLISKNRPAKGIFI